MTWDHGIDPVFSLGNLEPQGYPRTRPAEWQVRARGLHLEHYRDGAKYVEEVESRKVAPEYECPWCGATNLMAERQCPQCGGFRPPLG